MPRLARIRLLFSALLLLSCVSGAEAAKPSQYEVLRTARIRRTWIGMARGGPSCQLGQPGASGATTANLIVPPDDHYYTLLKPNQCLPCDSTNHARLTAAHVLLYFPKPCTQPVEISIIGAGGTDSCAVPDPLTVICPPIQADLTATEVGAVDFGIALPDSCEFATSAFLNITFTVDGDSCNTISSRPRLVLANTCDHCFIYNYFDTDKCDLCYPDITTCSVEGGIPGNPIMYVDVASCYTPTRRTSWGQIKIRYR